MFKGEKRTVFLILSIYLVSTFLVLFAITFTYFYIEKDKFLDGVTLELTNDAKVVSEELETLHNNYLDEMIYPRFEQFESAIFDSDKQLIFSTFKEDIDFERELYRKDGFTYFIYPQTPYYLGSAFIVIKKKTKTFLEVVDKRILLLPLLIFMIIIFTSFFLIRIILKPLRENIQALDDFIKDTTHELNTPIATIQSNLELLENIDIDEKTNKKIERIKSATIAIKNLYEDLVFLTLNKSLQSSLQNVSFNELLKNRLEYFSLLFKSKSLTVRLVEEGNLYLMIDATKITRVVDNLISNSIKYTNKNKKITITINEKYFMIEDEGIGMSEDEVAGVFERFARFDTKEVGFGIGYNIIYKVIKEYDLKIDISSKKGEGTCVKISC